MGDNEDPQIRPPAGIAIAAVEGQPFVVLIIGHEQLGQISIPLMISEVEWMIKMLSDSMAMARENLS